MKLPLSNSRFQIGGARRGRASLTIGNWQSAIGNPTAFTLVEILIVVALLSFIIIGLLAMFGQTQRAFRLGMTQNDVLESGRLASGMIFRELEQVTPSYLPATDNLGRIEPNFYAWVPNYAPLVQELPGLDPLGNEQFRTNLLEDLFFLIRQNQEWIGIGYFVRTNSPITGALGWPLVGPAPGILGAGTLCRFETNAPALSGRTPADVYRDFYDAAYNNKWPVSKIMDGVVHFRIRTYNTNGNWIVSNTNVSASATQTNTDILLSEFSARNVAPGEVVQSIFYSNAVPASVEFEIGVLEDRVWERYQSLDPASQYRYLTNQVGHVHLFRQRVTIRCVDPLAYR